MLRPARDLLGDPDQIPVGAQSARLAPGLADLAIASLGAPGPIVEEDLVATQKLLSLAHQTGQHPAHNPTTMRNRWGA